MGGLGIYTLASLAAVSVWAATTKNSKTLPAGKVHEECVTLKPNQNLRYSFNAKGPLDFNLHYHAGKEVHYPVKEDQASAKQGSFQPTSKQDYCLMWTNKSKQETALNYDFEVN